MMVLGIDPGQRVNGWALLDFSISTSPVWFDGGTFGDVEHFFAELIGLGHTLSLVAVEQAVAMHNPLANVQAMGTAWAGGVAFGMAKGLGFHVKRFGVNQWRQAFVGHSKKGDNVDAKIKAALFAFVRGMPPRTNVHMRDAAGVACVGARDYRQVATPQGGYGGRGSMPCQDPRRASEAASVGLASQGPWERVRVTVAGMTMEPTPLPSFHDGPIVGVVHGGEHSGKVARIVTDDTVELGDLAESAGDISRDTLTRDPRG